jgi:hypothetical protein
LHVIFLLQGMILPFGIDDDKADARGAEPLAEDGDGPALPCSRLGDDAGAAGDELLRVYGELPVPGGPDDEVHKEPGGMGSIKLSTP